MANKSYRTKKYEYIAINKFLTRSAPLHLDLVLPSSLHDVRTYDEYSKRIKKSLYYGKLPSRDRPSFPLTGILVNSFEKFCKSKGLNKLKFHEAASICHSADVSPCSAILALLYLERLRAQNPDYLSTTTASQVFVIALMVASKYLYDAGEDEEVYNPDWAESAGMMVSDFNEAEREFLAAINWNLFVDVSTFLDELSHVESAIALHEGNSRGFYVYSDIVVLLETLSSIWPTFLKLVGATLIVCVVSYSVTVLIMVTGPLVAKEYGSRIANRISTFVPSPLSTGHDISIFSSYHSGGCETLNNSRRLLLNDEDVFNCRRRPNEDTENCSGQCFSTLEFDAYYNANGTVRFAVSSEHSSSEISSNTLRNIFQPINRITSYPSYIFAR